MHTRAVNTEGVLSLPLVVFKNVYIGTKSRIIAKPFLHIVSYPCIHKCKFLKIVELLSIILFELLGVLWVLPYPASHPNHTSYIKFYFYEFVANVLHDNMGMIIFDLRSCGGCERPKTSYLNAHFGNVRFIPQHQFCIPKILELRSVMTFSLHVSNSRTKHPGLDF